MLRSHDGVTIVLWALLATCAIVYSVCAVRAELLADEAWTRSIARLPLSTSWPYLVQDAKHPPLYGAIQIALQPFLGVSIAVLRVPSIIFALATIPAVFSLGIALGASRRSALLGATWAALHPQMLEHAVNARSYSLFGLLVVVYWIVGVSYIREPARSRGLLLAGVVILLLLTHSFSVLFIAGGLAAAAAQIRVQTGRWWSPLARAVLAWHVPGALILGGWFVLFAVSAAPGGVTSGLEWTIQNPSGAERIYAAGRLLGNADVPRGTTLTIALIGALLATTMLRSDARSRITTLVLLLAAWLPFLAQTLAVGIVADLPLWGTRHLHPMIPLMGVVLAVGVAGAIRSGGEYRSARMWSTAALGLVGLQTLMLMHATLSVRSPMRTAVERMLEESPGAQLAAAWSYGDVGVLNAYFDPSCTSAYQLHEQYRQVARDQPVANPCRVKSVDDISLRDAPNAVIVVVRQTVSGEVERFTALLSRGWRIDRTANVGDTSKRLLVQLSKEL